MPQSGRPSLLETRREVQIWTKPRKRKREVGKEGAVAGKAEKKKPTADGGGYCGHRGPLTKPAMKARSSCERAW